MLPPSPALRSLRALRLPGLVAIALILPAACMLSTAGIDGPVVCGDGFLDPSEACDGDDLGGMRCEDLGHPGGTLACSAQCTLDESGCTVGNVCGDGEARGGEPCDGPDLGGKDCTTLGHLAGKLACTGKCQLDESACFDAPGDWRDVAWKHRRSITLHGSAVAEQIPELAVLVDVQGDWLSFARPDGADFVFTAADGKTPLPFEIERFSSSPPHLTAWVAVPALSPMTDTLLYLYYDNPLATPGPPIGPVWSDGYAGVWHLAEPTTAGQNGAFHADATGQGRDGTQNGNGAEEGKIGGGQHFDGQGNFIDIAHPEAFVLGDSDCTISAWVKTASTQPMGILLKSKANVHESGDKLFGVNHTAKKLGQDQGWVDYVGGISDITDGAWHYVVWTQQKNASGDQESWDLYVDGGHDTSKNATTKGDVAGHTLRIGWHADGSYFDKPFDGSIDEVRVSTVRRSQGWIATTFENQRDPASFYTLGNVQSLPK